MKEAINIARQRGDLEHPTFRQLRSAVPGWLLKLGTEEGVAELESEYSVTLPPVVRRYAQHPEIAAVIEGGCDLNAFLNQLADYVGEAPPYVLYHDRRAHLVIAFHNHSGGVCAVDLDGSETVIRFGDPDLANFDLHPYDDTAYNFEEWVVSCVHNADPEFFPHKSRSYPVVPD